MPIYELKDRIKQLRETYYDLTYEIENNIAKENINKMLYLRLNDLDQMILILEMEYLKK